MVETLRYGLIGAGMMGREHLRNLQLVPGSRVTALSDPVEASLAQSARLAHDLFGEAPAVFADHRALLARGEIDALVIASPNDTHAAILADVFAAPRAHAVLVEKPACTRIEDCAPLAAAAASHRAPIWVAMEYRYMPPVAELRREVREGAVGRLRMLAIREHRYPFLAKVGDWNRFARRTGGTLVEKCCHYFDLMRLIAEDEPVRVYASGAADVNHRDERHDGAVPDILDNAFVIVEYDNGIRANLDLCMFAEASRNEQELSVVGTLGKVEAAVPGDGSIWVGERSDRSLTSVADPIDERVAHVGFHFGASFIEVARFCDAVRNGTGPDVDVNAGLWSVAVGVAAHRSIDEGRPVLIDELGV